MTPADEHLTAASIVVAAGRPDRVPDAPTSTPVVFTSTYVAGGPTGYGRSGNPVWTSFEEVLGALEGGPARVFASGMAAISAVLSFLTPGTTVVAPVNAYNTTVDLLDACEAGGVIVRRVPTSDTAATIAALQGADLVWIESPTNPMLEVADIAAVCAAARAAGVLSVCDNTFATPLLQRPLELGADVVVHSVTKFLSGHSDVVLGAVVVRPDAPDILSAVEDHRRRHGAVAGPMEVWLALRGIRTLAVRMERACASAALLAARLGEHASVTRVRYPGFGAIVAIEVGDVQRADQVCATTSLWLPATSLGGVESLIERRRRWPLEPVTVPEDLIRLSVGIEDPEDLWRDLDRALRAASTSG